MSKKITRRQALATGAVSTGMFLGRNDSSYAQTQSNKGPGREPFWEPGPNKNLVRDLTPGPTPIRISGHVPFKEGDDVGEYVRKLREAGFSSTSFGPDPWYSMSDSQLSEFRAAQKQHNVVIFEIGGYRNLLHTDETVRRENIKRIAYCLEAADKIGCPMVGTISGSRNPEGNEWRDNYAVHPDNWTMETWNLLIDSLRQILRDTSGMKAVIGMEAQITTNQDTPLSHKRLMEDVGDERLKINLDPTNMCHLYNHFHTTELINECFDLLGEDIMGCHAKDTYVLPHSQTVHVQEVCPGRGNMDYETYIIRMSRLKWPRTIHPEHIPSDQYPEAHAYIRKVAAKVGVKIL